MYVGGKSYLWEGFLYMLYYCKYQYREILKAKPTHFTELQEYLLPLQDVWVESNHFSAVQWFQYIVCLIASHRLLILVLLAKQ